MGVFGTIAVSLLQEPLHGSDQSDLADPYMPMIVDVAPAFFMMAASALLLAAFGTFEAKNKGMNKHASSHLSNQSPCACSNPPCVRDWQWQDKVACALVALVGTLIVAMLQTPVQAAGTKVEAPNDIKYRFDSFDARAMEFWQTRP